MKNTSISIAFASRKRGVIYASDASALCFLLTARLGVKCGETHLAYACFVHRFCFKNRGIIQMVLLLLVL